MTDAPKGWLASNLANWEERTALHFEAEEYDLTPLRAGQGALFSIEERELPAIKGKRVLHLQCHFGRDSLVLAQRGAQVVGVDSRPLRFRARRSWRPSWGCKSRPHFMSAICMTRRMSFRVPENAPQPGPNPQYPAATRSCPK